MKPRLSSRLLPLATALLLPGILAASAASSSAQSDSAAAPAQEPATALQVTRPIARIEGDDFSVRGQVNLEHETGRNIAELASGAEVTVRSKYARIELLGGGEIGICGPAKFTLLRSDAAITLALDYGRIHASLNSAQPVIIYTPFVVATPVTVSAGKNELQLGIEAGDKMCVYALHGAARLEPQLGGQAIVVPQNTEVSLTQGQLDSVEAVAGSCQCDALEALARPTPTVRVDVGVLAQSISGGGSSTAQATDPATQDARPATEEPVWKVLMPPLSVGVDSGRSPAAPSPERILLLREVQVEDGAVFHGTVVAATPEPKNAKPAPQEKLAVQSPAAPAQVKKLTFGQRVKNFFRRLFGGKPKNAPATTAAVPTP